MAGEGGDAGEGGEGVAGEVVASEASVMREERTHRAVAPLRRSGHSEVVTSPDADSGALGTLDGASRTVRLTRSYPHPADRVWVAVSDPGRLVSWFPQRVVGDLMTPGSRLRFESAEGTHPPFAGEVLRADPPRGLEFTWGTDAIGFEVAPSGEGCTFTLTDVVDNLGKAARDAAGWHTCLDSLAGALDGRPPARSTEDRWAEVHQRYVAAFGPEASTIGPPDGRRS